MDHTRWRKATLSDGVNNCVEIHPDGAVRDSKHPGAVLRVDLASLLAAVRAGLGDPRA